MNANSNIGAKGIMSSAFSSPLLLSVAGVLVVVSFIRFLLHRPERLDIPIIEIPGSRDQREALVQGTARVSSELMFGIKETKLISFTPVP